MAPAVHAFTDGGLGDALRRAAAWSGAPAVRVGACTPQAIAEAANATLVTAWLPVGPLRDRWDGIAAALTARGVGSAMLRRDWDSRAWPHAERGFFQLRQKIPALLGHHHGHA